MIDRKQGIAAAFQYLYKRGKIKPGEASIFFKWYFDYCKKMKYRYIK